MKKWAILFGPTMSLSTQAAPIFNFFELGVQDSPKYDAIGEHNIRTSIQNEKGTLAMYSVKQKADPNMAYMLEIYADDAANDAHRQTAHFKHYLAQTEKMVVDK